MVAATLGAALILSYYVLKAFSIGKIGADADIGGGLLLLLGIVVLVAGFAMAAFALLRGRNDRGSGSS